MVSAAVVGRGFAVPPRMDQQQLWDGFFEQHWSGNRVARAVWASSGVRTRHGVVDPRVEDVSGWSTAARMSRFADEALPLAKGAASAALEDSGTDAAEVGLLTVVSCTGYATPGIDLMLARDLGLADSVQRLFVGHMGCYAALPGLGAVADYAVARERPALMLCVELTSLHAQPAAPTTTARHADEDELEQMVAHALFGDAAAAVVVSPSGPGVEVVDVVALTDHATGDHMTWDVTDLGFRMGLSPRVPDVLALHVRGVVDDLLGRHGTSIDQVAGWAVHPGGPRILDVVQDRLGLPDDALAESRETLGEFGNCSSATVLLVLDRVLTARRPASGSHLVVMAFGPGLTLYAALLRVR
ncbi:MAG: type III polyketide synthase [Frankiales bacterium]|nr:type III polyketide synthase [Frankiales bacterium]